MAHREKQHLSRRAFIAATMAAASGWALPGARAQSSNVNFRVTGSQDPRGPVALQAAHRPQPRFQPAVISLDRVVRVLLDGMQR